MSERWTRTYLLERLFAMYMYVVQRFIEFCMYKSRVVVKANVTLAFRSVNSYVTDEVHKTKGFYHLITFG